MALGGHGQVTPMSCALVIGTFFIPFIFFIILVHRYLALVSASFDAHRDRPMYKLQQITLHTLFALLYRIEVVFTLRRARCLFISLFLSRACVCTPPARLS